MNNAFLSYNEIAITTVKIGIISQITKLLT